VWLSLNVADLVPFHLRSRTPNSPIVNADSMSFLDLEQFSTHQSETGPGVQNVEQLDYQAAYAIVLRDAVAHVSRILEEGEQGLHPDHLEQTVTELEKEFQLQIGRRRPFQQQPGQSIPSTAPLNLQESQAPEYNSNAYFTAAGSYHEEFSQPFQPSTYSNSDDTLPSSSYDTDPSSVDGIDCRSPVHAYPQHKSPLQDSAQDPSHLTRFEPFHNNTSRLYFPYSDVD
jgi:hypothetical protein